MILLPSRELPFLFCSNLKPLSHHQALAPQPMNLAFRPFRRAAFTVRKKRDPRPSWTWGRVGGGNGRE